VTTVSDVTIAPVVCDQADHITRANANALANAQVEVERIRWTDSVQKNTLTALRGLISEGTLTKYEALDTYNAIAINNGWATIETITSTFTVEVCYEGNVVLTVPEVEADSAEEATAEVLANLEVDNIRLKFEVSYGDHVDYADVWVYDFDTDLIEAIAEEN
jgi:hypothetical protein